ncbi:hypothetical protein ACA910_006900 [Epithemia clementina (nom. ined.)]
MMNMKKDDTKTTTAAVFMVAATTTTIAAVAAAAGWILAWHQKRRSSNNDQQSIQEHERQEQKNLLRDLPGLVPWYRSGFWLEFAALIWHGGLPPLIQARRRALPRDFTFTFHWTKCLVQRQDAPHVILTHPQDIAYIYSQQRKLALPLAVPGTIHLLHGSQNMQELSGTEHFFYRKLFSSLLSPRALTSFLPYIEQAMDQLWKSAEQETTAQQALTATTTTTSKLTSSIVLRESIRRAQFFLMAQILYGIDVQQEPELAARLQRNFELEDAAVMDFSPHSKTFQKGLQSSKETRQILWDRFLQTLQTVQKEHSSNNNNNNKAPNEQQRDQKDVGNAFYAIAEALVESGQDKDESVLNGIQDNLILLLEASHGTTMNVTTAIMYYLNHPDPDGVAAMQRLRHEFRDFPAHPTLSDFKEKLPFADAVINETLRLCPFVGMLLLFLDQGKRLELPRRQSLWSETTTITTTTNGKTTTANKGESSSLEEPDKNKKSTLTLTGPLHLVLASSHWYRDASLYDNPNQFRPERWLDGTMSELAKTAYCPFGGGVHICLGMHLAKLVMKVNLYCFCKDEHRRVIYDPQKVGVRLHVFPEWQVTDGLPCQVVGRNNNENNEKQQTK